MPELPEVETVRRGLAPTLVGARISRVEMRRENLRIPFPQRFAERLQGRQITALQRRAKYLIAALDDNQALIAHLGMSGSFRVENAADPVGSFVAPHSKDPAHDHVVIHLDDSLVTYNDPRRFGFMTLADHAQLDALPFFANLGVEPLSNNFNSETLAELFAGRKTSLKAALLDQKLIAGLGNIYVCEALHRAGLAPDRPASDIAARESAPTGKTERLVRAIRAVLEEAIAAGGSSLRDHRQADGSLGYFQHNFGVYGRTGESCPKPKCKGIIQRRIQNGRSTFFCPQCQK
ncbi:bifunctional DNA-formamidopyrimidine glycosylase/DNA-(apurinic or apyrimidinic site) lyase [Rhodoblastus acidophilus]|uniref:Formamidopyrimidine-DNA glycosylase n=1 Tax=Candidatus Rhodoblastus alkanivorans TaxID=2954117 RepID=A0ABS9Z1C6_9HYPH|nr:bifunctional DNA-formamidopyrimidine glycosylase/DNA-(apurinic or apyrimidinic site) lyase [Candidatus Rhodoblastus alkanivorans]MCI4679435.1 bifunctional DNA-formamidopyrimidine glycosylase/DNA-(apurinic or apyrimidinic site) lyase [Candidatus Rhodoblastus alkanivorans]MCI4681443.1 bifunctional DNA-formamidopyrimidine glycosylase/DNA-(apurinic or apyrimidinic site) lyase [Candidatus Rhodoblastus alkanivorans]MDI4642491.1 bifunctional DNA-formamidopyrimidine glycosylase/DNA-(apurinic or apyri